MYNENFKNIVNIDISDVIIVKMKELNKDKTEMTCKIFFNITHLIVLEMDATAMTFADQEFDFVIDKGTLDALMVITLLLIISVQILMNYQKN